MYSRKKITYKKERVVFSDILPYEIPINFSNRYFYNFLVDYKVEIKNDILQWETYKNDPSLNNLIKFIFNIKKDVVVETEEKKIQKKGKIIQKIINKVKLKSVNFVTIPFTFNIAHKENEFRELSVIHPVNQVAMIDFYDNYKELILYYSNISPFSIRKPVKVAKFTYFKDRLYKMNKVSEPDREIVEIFGEEYKNLKTFFSYKKYSNIYKFYDSYLYQRNEKKYDKMVKFDIMKCFNSIYTHSLSWAIWGKENVKENLKSSKFTFTGKFDTVMQNLNYNETNGIIIGPEFSRIFAEILLQHIDFKIYKILEYQKEIYYKIDYEMFRYIDDYFLFYNKEEVKEKILELFKIELKKFKLYINESKSSLYTKPIITNITIAKEKIKKLLTETIKLNSNEKNITVEESNGIEIQKRYYTFFNSKKTIINFKTIVKESNIKYNEVLNYTFAIIDKRVFNVIKKYDKISLENMAYGEKFKIEFINFMFEILDFVFFIYAVSPNVSTTIKLCTILSKIIKFIKGKKLGNNSFFSKDMRDIILKKIFDEASLILNKNKFSVNTQVETLYLLILLRELGREYRLSQGILKKYLGIGIDNEIKLPFNYFSITVLLFYIKNMRRYSEIREILKTYIIENFKKKKPELIRKTAELVLLSLDLVSCPYLDNNFKTKILNLGDIKKDTGKTIEIIMNRKNWFNKWKNFDFEKELNTKISQEVY